MERIVGLSAAADVLGVSISTLRRWEAAGKLVAEHAAGGHRPNDLAKLRREVFRAAAATSRKAYARVSPRAKAAKLFVQMLPTGIAKASYPP
jgi:putative resolvase